MNTKFEIITKSNAETKSLGALLADTLYKGRTKKRALVISLEGDLGAGKTTFTQGFADGLGIKEKVKSPTFVILKIYKIKKMDFIHIDAYRIGTKDFEVLGWKEFIKNPKNIILVEWGDRIKKILPRTAIHIKFKHGASEHERTIKFVV